MSSSISRADLRLDATYWESPVLRLAMVLLALLGLLGLGHRPTGFIVPASAVYLTLSLLIWLLAGHRDLPWLAYGSGLLDISYVTLVLWLYPGTAASLWLLYLIPVAAAAAAGRTPAIVLGGLSLGCYLAISTWAADAVPSHVLWPLAVLAAGMAFMISVAPTWTPERREWRFWPEILAAVRGLGRAGSLDAAASLIVERVRRLTRCDGVWLAWCDEDRRLRIAATSGSASEAPVPVQSLDEWMLDTLLQGPVPLTDLVAESGRDSGEAVALSYAGGVALLAVISERRRLHRAARGARLRAFVSWASDALTEAQERDWLRARLAREQALAEAGRSWAATENPMRVQEAALRAVQVGLDGHAAMLDRASGRVLLGDATLASRIDEPARAWLRAAPDPGSWSPERSGPDTVEIVTVRRGLAIALTRAGARFDEAELEWLDALASGLSGALERCATHAAVEAETERMRAAVEATPAPVAIWDNHGRLVLANSTYSSLDLGAAPPVQPTLTEAQEIEVVAGTPPRTFVATIVPVMSGAYLLAHYREVTREREALRAKDELIAMVGHELRSPLTSIRGYSQMMSKQLRIVQSQVTQLDSLLSDFVEAAQRQSQELQLSRSRLDLGVVVMDAAERFRGAHEDRTLRVTVDDGLMVDGDGTRLAQVVDNLLGNAAKYSPSDSAIELTGTRGDGQVLVSVRDAGIGIDPRHLPSLFDRFYRVPAAAEMVKGLGLGLSIVRDIVAAHGGTVWAESAGEGHGSTFWVALPEASGGEAPVLQEASAAGIE